MRINKLMIAVIAAGLMMVTGCATNFPNPIPNKARKGGSGQPTIQITQQGTIPAIMSYRTMWPTSAAPDAKKKSIPAEVIVGVVGAAVDGATSLGNNYFTTIKEIQRYRVDVFFSGYENLDPQSIKDILENATRPQHDAMRPAFYVPNGK